jgi:hypothetical protein
MGQSQTTSKNTDQRKEMGMDRAYFTETNDDLTREALDWNPQEVRRRRRPTMRRSRTIDEEMNRIGTGRKRVKQLSRRRVRWRNFIEALCSI